jgi:hydrogenase maturation protease
MTTMSASPTRVLIIGVGNAYRGDDGAGIAVARQLAQQAPAGIEVLQESGEGTALVEAWKGAQFVVVVDAIRSGAAPGTIRRLDARKEAIRRELFRNSTHAFGVAGAIELSRTLNELPAHLIVYGIEGQEFTPGAKLSTVVQKGVPLLAAQAVFEAERWRAHEIEPIEECVSEDAVPAFI